MALYTANVHVTGGREGHAESSDGLLKVDLRLPKELGGAGGATNPEQLFAAGYGACFEGALGLVARQEKAPIQDVAFDVAVSLNPKDGGGFLLSVVMDISIGGVDQATAEALVAKAHQVCPYSNATRGNIDVQLNVTAK